MGWMTPAVSMSFRNLFFEKNETMLVNGVSGFVKAETMVAVIGEGATPLFEVKHPFLAGSSRISH